MAQCTTPKHVTKKTPQYEKQADGTKKKIGDKEKMYRIDADFIPTKVDDICQEFIANYCEKNNQGDWLVDELSETITSKSGKEIPKPFTLIRKDFAEKFFNITADNKNAVSWREQMLKKFKK